VEEDLRKGRADIGITYLPTGPEFQPWELTTDEFVVLFPPDFTTSATSLTWEDLVAYPMIMAPDGDGCDAMVYAHCDRHQQALNVAYQVRSDATIVNMVAQGIGAAISPRLAAEPIPARIQVYRLPVPLFRVITVAILEEALLTPAAFAFLDLVRTDHSSTQFTSIKQKT
jgi:DNA-binding transcriptional LysR family regulator